VNRLAAKLASKAGVRLELVDRGAHGATPKAIKFLTGSD